MAVRETTQARQAALLVYGLPLARREDVLARLDASEASRIKRMLAELAELGLSQSLGHELQQLVTAPAEKRAADASALQLQVEQLDARDVARCLQSCSPIIVARLLRTCTWPWEAQLFACMSIARRDAVHEAMRNDTTPLAPAVLRTVCERLCLRAADVVVEHHDDSGAPELQITGQRPHQPHASVAARLKGWFEWTR